VAATATAANLAEGEAAPGQPVQAFDVLSRVRATSKARAKEMIQSVDPFEDPVPMRFFLVADLVVLGTVGFTAGALGFLFVGFSFKPLRLPGMFALAFFNIAGLGLQKLITGNGL
jgi:hypothetical protein